MCTFLIVPSLHSLHTPQYTRAVQKDTEFFFYLLLHLQLIRLVSFKVLPSTVDTPLPAFFPVLERVLERILRDGAKVLQQIFFYLLYHLKSTTFQGGLQLWEQEKVRRAQIWRVGRLGHDNRLLLRQKFTDKKRRVGR